MLADFFDVESLLSDDERAARDTLRRWVDANLMPYVSDWYLRAEFPDALIPKLGELGLLGANLPQEYGCASPRQQ